MGQGDNKPTGATPAYPNTDGWASATGGKTGYVIAFNALQQMQRTAVSFINGNIYLASASHDDDGPYYGWILGYKESNLQLDAAFVTTPTYEGIVGNRANNTPRAASGCQDRPSPPMERTSTCRREMANFIPPGNFNAQGFPIDHDYGDSLLKLAIDPGSSPANQNGNGWGLKVADYFTPSNENYLNEKDLDLGSGGVTLLPNILLDKAGNPMLIVGGKEGRTYLIDRDNLGKFNYSYPAAGSPDPRDYDRVLGEFTRGGIFSSDAYFNGQFYIGGWEPSLTFKATAFASGTVPPGPGHAQTRADHDVQVRRPGPDLHDFRQRQCRWHRLGNQPGHRRHQ